MLIAEVEDTMVTALGQVNKEVMKLFAVVSEFNNKLMDRTNDLVLYQCWNKIRIFGITESAREFITELWWIYAWTNLVCMTSRWKLCTRHNKVAGTPNLDQTANNVLDQLSPVSQVTVTNAWCSHKWNSWRVPASSSKKTTLLMLELLRRATTVYGVCRAWTQDECVMWLNKKGFKFSHSPCKLNITTMIQVNHVWDVFLNVVNKLYNIV